MEPLLPMTICFMSVANTLYWLAFTAVSPMTHWDVTLYQHPYNWMVYNNKCSACRNQNACQSYSVCIGLEISGYGGQLIVGEHATISCSFDLEFSSLEWIFSNKVLVSSLSSQIGLSFSPVNDSVHGRQYTCRVTTQYGVQEKNVTILVQGEHWYHRY